jgi:hypothetical protein
MSDIFISYSREDFSAAELLAEALAEEGWSVWWDRSIPAGRSYDQVLEEEIDGANRILVLWSASSINSEWVIASVVASIGRREISAEMAS